ncbi:MAG: tRNA pseudouridine(55) synthase TruB [Hyphomicrobiaceae bacterium]
MARRKKGNPVSGWLILDKPQGMTSTQAVGKIRWLFDAQKAGHAGTLDPLATGVLPIALGEATKTVSHAVDGDKAYRFTVRWGVETDTDDAEGQVVETSDQRPDAAAIRALLPEFVGSILQRPPSFSAIKVNGERAYDLARDGELVELDARPVDIDRLDLVASPDAESSVFEAECGKGTYVRSLARDMGRRLGCFGHVTALRRTRVGAFDETTTVKLDALIAATEAAGQRGRDVLGSFLLPVEAALADLEHLAVSQQDAANLVQGRAVLIRGRDAPVMSGPIYATCKGRLIAIGEIEKGAMHPTRVFNVR